jgi:hypothetical protein
MIERCTKPHSKSYKFYGGRGISVDSRWLDFDKFVEDLPEYESDEHQLDRADNNANYCPGNCVWSTRKQNCRNRRNTVTVTYKGQLRKLIELCEELGVEPGTAKDRLKRGWPIERALAPTTQPWTKNPQVLLYNGKEMTITEIARSVGMSDNLLRSRLRKGMSVESAVMHPAKHRSASELQTVRELCAATGLSVSYVRKMLLYHKRTKDQIMAKSKRKSAQVPGQTPAL